MEYNFHAPEKPTREDLVTSIFNKISASNALVSLQQSDRLGITTPEELREETIPLLKKQVAMLNRHLDLQLQKRAKWVSEKLHIRISELPTDVTQFEETYGISYAAMLNRIAQTSGTVTRVLRLQWRDELAGLKRSRAGTHDEEIKRLEELLAADVHSGHVE